MPFGDARSAASLGHHRLLSRARGRPRGAVGKGPQSCRRTAHSSLLMNSRAGTRIGANERLEVVLHAMPVGCSTCCRCSVGSGRRQETSTELGMEYDVRRRWRSTLPVWWLQRSPAPSVALTSWQPPSAWRPSSWLPSSPRRPSSMMLFRPPWRQRP